MRLDLLHIENIAIIERSEITFAPGFNALTGETGAGKSIVIDSINAVLGQRTSRDLIRTGAEKAFVSACFTQVDAAAIADLGFVPDEEGCLLLQREITADGKNLCRVGGRPVTVSQLRTLGCRLLNIHGQHDGQQLLDEEQHLHYLDRFAQSDSLLHNYTEKYNSFTEFQRKMNALRMDEAEKARRIDTLQYQISELERAKLRPGEEEELTARRTRLRNGEKLISAISEADYCLNGDDNHDGALRLLKQAQETLGGIRLLGEEYASLFQRLETLHGELYDIADTVRDQKDGFEFSPTELDDIEARLDQLYRLKKKYGATVEDMLDYLEKCRQELDNIQYAEDTLAHMEKQLGSARKAVVTAAKTLSDARRSAAKSLADAICEELRQLDMGRIRFSVDFKETEPNETGMDGVQFLMSANEGEALKPIHKIASGGELARVMLAMKTILSAQEQVGTMVFDEVDTGVSGRAAQKVAEKMARISRHKQVLCVTHLPQLAAMADTHFSVEKRIVKGRTLTEVTRLDHAARCTELARLTGGSQVTEAQLHSAGELLRQADEFKRNLL